jgi:hypothetical protein
VDLVALLDVQGGDPKIHAAAQDVELGGQPAAIGKGGHFDLGVVVEAQVVAEPELDFQPAAPRAQLVAFDDDQVDLPLLVAEVLGPLDVDVALNVAHPRVAPVVITGGLSERGERQDDGCCDGEKSYASHLFSPYALFKCEKRANQFSPVNALKRAVQAVLFLGHLAIGNRIISHRREMIQKKTPPPLR